MSTWALEMSAVTVLLALVAVLAVRTGLAERAAGTGDRTGSTWSRPTLVRRLDAAAAALAVLGVGVLVTIVVTGAPVLS